MSAPEFSRIVRIDEIGQGLTRDISASEIERAALSRRFGLNAITLLTAVLSLRPSPGGYRLTGTVRGRALAQCAVSAETTAQDIDESIDLELVQSRRRGGPPRSRSGVAEGEDDWELDEGDLDTLIIENGRIDWGEIAATSFALAIDPYPRADPAQLAEARRHLLSEEEAAAKAEAEKEASSPFSGLKRN